MGAAAAPACAGVLRSVWTCRTRTGDSAAGAAGRRGQKTEAPTIETPPCVHASMAMERDEKGGAEPLLAQRQTGWPLRPLPTFSGGRASPPVYSGSSGM